nr:hypothetical protein SAVMC3_86530 [Streptomyces avermitilis]
MAARVITFFGLDGSGPVPGPQPGTCKVAVTTNAWNTGLTASVTLTNTGTTAVNGWKLGFTLSAGQTVTNGWGATYTQAGTTVTATNATYNGAIAPGGSVGIGYQAGHTGNSAAPTAFTLNGTACTVT